jgi:hypothetical protein
MALNITAIREALASVVTQACTDTGYTPNVYAYPPDSPLTPAVMVMPAPFDNGQYVNYWGTFARSLCAVGLRLEVRIGGNDVDSQKTLDEYLSTVVPAIIAELTLEANKTLGGNCEVVHLRDASVPGRFAPAEGETRTWLSSSVPIEVHARRS